MLISKCSEVIKNLLQVELLLERLLLSSPSSKLVEYQKLKYAARKREKRRNIPVKIFGPHSRALFRAVRVIKILISKLLRVQPISLHRNLHWSITRKTSCECFLVHNLWTLLFYSKFSDLDISICDRWFLLKLA